MNYNDLKNETNEALMVKLKELREDILDTYHRVQDNQEKDTSKLSKKRKDTARILTMINERKK